MFSDGEYFSGKGVGRVAISPKEGIEVDVFVTHTISEGSNLIANTPSYHCLFPDKIEKKLYETKNMDPFNDEFNRIKLNNI